jgi:hypothetical protein
MLDARCSIHPASSIQDRSSMGNSNSGRGGLPRAKRRELERLLAAGWKNAHIARHVGCDVSTVSRIKRRMRDASTGSAQGSAQGEESQQENVRCGSCGGLLAAGYDHCVPCLLRKTVFRRGAARRSQKARMAA